MDKKSDLSAIILVAGFGKRISNYTSKPKCLLKIKNSTIIERNLKYLNELGINKIYIVVGYKASEVKKKIKNFLKRTKINVKIIKNIKYLTHGNCYSLYLALLKVNSDVIYFDGDLVYDKNILIEYLKHKSKNSVLVGKGNEKDIECAKIFYLNHNIKRIVEKRIYKNKKYKFLGESLGINKLEQKYIDVFINLAKKKFKIKKNLNLNWDTFYDKFILNKLKIKYCFTKKNKWTEIDTYEDYKASLKIFK